MLSIGDMINTEIIEELVFIDWMFVKIICFFNLKSYHHSCDDYTSNPAKDSAPSAMVSLDLQLPPSDHVDTWDLLDGGQLGPAVRLGWFVSHAGQEDLTHWKLLTDSEVAKNFRPNKIYNKNMFSPPPTHFFSKTFVLSI